MTPQSPSPSAVVSSRRSLLRNSAVAAAAALVVPKGVYAAGEETIKVGIVGCGGRGSGAAIQALKADKRNQLVALGDAFMDKLVGGAPPRDGGKPIPGALDRFKANGEVGAQVTATPDTCFAGLDAYKKVIDMADVVLLTTPPAFRATHFQYAVDKGKHIFAEKPLCVDAAGYRAVQASVAEAKKKGLAFVDGFCWRYEFGHRELFPRLHDGAIGDLLNIYSHYNASELWNHPRKPDWSDTEWQVRNWLYFTWLSGDHIVEQAVHSIDKVAWAMKDVMPVKAWGTGGRQVRTDAAFGHIWDHFAVVYEWADGTRAHVYCRQQNQTEAGVKDFYLGTKGRINLTSGSVYQIFNHGQAEPAWKYGQKGSDMYQQEHNELFASIRAGKPLHAGERVANSAMMAILGRIASYTGRSVTWEQATTAKESLMPATLDLKSSMPTPEVPMPGKTKIV